MTREENGAYVLAPEADISAALEKLWRYENMHEALLRELAGINAKLGDLRGRNRTKTATFRQLLAEKLMLVNFQSRLESYGLRSEPDANP